MISRRSLKIKPKISIPIKNGDTGVIIGSYEVYSGGSIYINNSNAPQVSGYDFVMAEPNDIPYNNTITFINVYYIANTVPDRNKTDWSSVVTNLEYPPAINTYSMRTSESLFGYSSYSNIGKLSDAPRINTSSCTKLSNLFYYQQFLKNVPCYDTKNVINMYAMFRWCSVLNTIPRFNTSKVTNMSYMFYNCKHLQSIPELDTSNVTTMSNMFNTCTYLTTIPLLNTSKLIYMDSMFNTCTYLTTIPLLDTSNVIAMDSLFYACNSLTSIPQLNTSKVTNMSYMFYACRSLTTIPQLDTSKVNYMNYMFAGCTSLVGEFPWEIDCSGITTVAGLQKIFDNSGVVRARFKNVKASLEPEITANYLGLSSITIVNTIP